MKGKLNPAPMSGGSPAEMMAARVYTDVNDQDWKIGLGKSMNLVASPGADAANYYSRPADYIAATASNYDAVCEALDAWVDQWNAGQNPQPQIQTDVTSSKPTAGAGAGVLGLIILAVLVLSDKKRR